jgi:hypothetical protein
MYLLKPNNNSGFGGVLLGSEKYRFKTGSVEVRGSSPLGSTNLFNDLTNKDLANKDLAKYR